MFFMNIKYDSRKIEAGDTFIAMKGLSSDGHEYIPDAIKRGAKMIIAEHGLYSVDTLIVKDTREYLTNYLKETYEEELKGLKLIGMTGTNGKTTTCFLIYQALNQLGIKCAYIGTIGFYLEDKVTELSNTTPDLLEIYEMLLESKQANCEYVVMEVSSHALDMNRLGGLEFDMAIFSNLTKDHLDYHLDMKSYALAKQKLFYKLKHNGIAMVNADDDYKSFFLVHNNIITYGLNEGDYQISNYKIDIHGSTFILDRKEYHSTLIGKHNLYNMLVVILVLQQLKFEVDDIANTISKLEAPKGRMEMIPYYDNIIVVDYAHTPDAVENIVSAFQEIEHSHLYTIVGCGGNRDKSKRPMMARIATTLSDFVIITSDNPRNEEPMDIIGDMVSNLDNTNYEIEENRALAITRGIQMMDKNDILLVLGKGHEAYQLVKGNKIHFSDLEIIQDLIK